MICITYYTVFVIICQAFFKENPAFTDICIRICRERTMTFLYRKMKGRRADPVRFTFQLDI